METKLGYNTNNYNNTKRSSSVPLSKNKYSYSDDDSNSDSWTTSSSSPDSSPVSDIPITPIKKFNYSFERLSNSSDSFNEILTPISGFKILLILMIFLSSLLLFNYPIQSTIIKSYIINSTAINTSNSTISNKIIQTVDWWSQYSRYCCLMINNTGIYSRVAGDCSANGKCMFYLNCWLEQYIQTFWNSTWTKDCCYIFRPINSDFLNIYCSYTCLNTERIKIY